MTILPLLNADAEKASTDTDLTKRLVLCADRDHLRLEIAVPPRHGDALIGYLS